MTSRNCPQLPAQNHQRVGASSPSSGMACRAKCAASGARSCVRGQLIGQRASARALGRLSLRNPRLVPSMGLSAAVKTIGIAAAPNFFPCYLRGWCVVRGEMRRRGSQDVL